MQEFSRRESWFQPIFRSILAKMKGGSPVEDLKKIIARNITELRRAADMTQLELAEKLNYTDKAVSKWERGESVPDVSVLKAIADLFGVKVDYLLTVDHVEGVTEVLLSEDADDEAARHTRRRQGNYRTITLISVLLVWLFATFAFVMAKLIDADAENHWLAFIYAVPLSFVVWLIFHSIWFRGRRNLLIISLLVWSLLAAIHISFVVLAPPEQFKNIWLLYILGVPGQAIILTWSRLMHRTKK